MPHTPSTSRRKVQVREEEELFFAASYGLVDRTLAFNKASERVFNLEQRQLVIWQGLSSLDDNLTATRLFARWDSDVRAEADNVKVVRHVRDNLETSSATALKISLTTNTERHSKTNVAGVNGLFRLPPLPDDFIFQYQVLFPSEFQCGSKGGRLPGLCLGDELLEGFWRWTSNSNFVFKCKHKPAGVEGDDVSLFSTRLATANIMRGVWTKLSLRFRTQKCTEIDESSSEAHLRITVDAFVNSVHCFQEVASVRSAVKMNLLSMRVFFGEICRDAATSESFVVLSDLKLLQA
eukprot:757018-Hanusia_phi.AAC.2